MTRKKTQRSGISASHPNKRDPDVVDYLHDALAFNSFLLSYCSGIACVVLVVSVGVLYLTTILGAFAAVQTALASLLAHETTAEYRQTAGETAPVFFLLL